MFQSIRSSQIALRIGLAIVFVWLGIDTFIMPQSHNGIFLVGIFEVAVAMSLATGFFLRVFSGIAAAFLVVVFLVNGPSAIDSMITSIGLIGGLIALALWPERTYI